MHNNRIQRYLHKAAGFTLIEIVIVIIIIASFTGLVSVNYVQYTEERKLDQALTELRTVMTISRTRALAGDIGSYPCGNFSGVTVQSDITSNQKFSTKLCCALNCGAPSFPLTTYTLPTNTEWVEPFEITYLPYAQGVVPEEELRIVVKNIFLNKCNSITISKIGVIDTGKPYNC